MFPVLSRHKRHLVLVLLQFLDRTNQRTLLVNDIHVQLAADSYAPGIHLERVGPQRHGTVQSVYRDTTRIEHRTVEGTALDVPALVGYGDLPDAGLIRLEYGTVSVVNLRGE